MSRRRFAALAMLSAAAGALVAFWAVHLRPATLGGPADYVVVTGESMEPTLFADDLVIVQRRAAYEPGDVIAFRVPEGAGAGATVIHRVIGGNGEDGYVTRGDNRGSTDRWRPTSDDVVGERWVRVPAVGLLVRWVADPVRAAAAAGVVVFAIVLLGHRPGHPRHRPGRRADEPRPAHGPLAPVEVPSPG